MHVVFCRVKHTRETASLLVPVNRAQEAERRAKLASEFQHVVQFKGDTVTVLDRTVQS